MPDNLVANAEDTPTSTPQEEGTMPPEPTFQFADTSEDGPYAEADEAPPVKYFGKYDTVEEAERGYKEAEREMHQAKEEAAAYRKAIENISQIPAQGQQQPPDTEAMNEQLRGHLESNPFPTLMSLAKMAIQQEREVENQQKSRLMGEFKKFSSDPSYKDVAQEVWQSIQYDPAPNVEMAFLRAKISRLSNGQARQSASNEAMNQRMHVESGRSAQPAETIRVELSPDARRVQGAFNMRNEDFVALNKRVAQKKLRGEREKAPVSIDDWIAQGGGR
jgi:hypothetical protein